MDIFNGFRGAAPTPGGAIPTPAQPGTVAPNPGGSQTVNPTVPSGTTPQSDGSLGAIPAAGTGEKSPLADYADLWKIDPKTPVAKTLTPQFNLDQAKINEAAAKIDFTQGLDPAELTKASKGDQAALAGIINKAAQAGFATALQANGSLLKQALTEQEKVFRESVMPDILRKHEISTGLRNENPLFANPAAAPMLTMLENQFAIKYPTASPQEITEHAKAYFSEFATQLITGAGGQVLPKATVAQNAGRALERADVDWEALLSPPVA